MDVKIGDYTAEKRISGNVTKIGYIMGKLKELGVKIAGKQDTLVSEGDSQNIKTINGESILGTGNISFPTEIPSTEGATSGDVLTFNGENVTWIAIPSQLPSTSEASAGYVLTFDGINIVWSAIPSQ